MDKKLQNLKNDLDYYISEKPVFTKADKEKVKFKVRSLSTHKKEKHRIFIPKTLSAIVIAGLVLFLGGIVSLQTGLFDLKSTERTEIVPDHSQYRIVAEDFLLERSFTIVDYLGTTDTYTVTKETLKKEPTNEIWGLLKIEVDAYLNQAVTVESFLAEPYSEPDTPPVKPIQVDVFVVNNEPIGAVQVFKTDSATTYKTFWGETIEQTTTKPYKAWLQNWNSYIDGLGQTPTFTFNDNDPYIYENKKYHFKLHLPSEWKDITTVNESDNRISVIFKAGNDVRQEIVTILVLDEQEYDQLKNPDGPSLLELKELARMNNQVYVYDGPHDIALLDTADIAKFKQLQKAIPDIMKTFQLLK